MPKASKKGCSSKKKSTDVKRIAPKKRSFMSTMMFMIRAFFGSLVDPNYGAKAKTRLANVHGIYDDAPTSTRTHIGQSDVPTSFGGGGG
mmetsp:Transcript_274/g.709  ORF Transcript_274/g.709 Transcript_274/m.709 type:complete len:89 (+) Transcript_274:120-386(+)